MPAQIVAWLQRLRQHPHSCITPPHRLLLFTAACLLLASTTLVPRSAFAQQPAQNTPDTAAPATFQPPGRIFLPQLRQGTPAVEISECPAVSTTLYGTVPVLGPPLARPAAQNPDINLAVRGYGSTADHLTLVDVDGDTDPQAPQLAALFSDHRAPLFKALYRVYDWDWACTEGGCLGQPIPAPPVTLVALDSQHDEPLGIPARGPQIYNGGYIALVLYAEETRLTITYTREDNPAIGYLAHLEDLCVDPALLALYRHLDTQGRSHLPGIRPQDLIGTAARLPLKIAIRDTGSFMDPRSRKDWWNGY